ALPAFVASSWPTEAYSQTSSRWPILYVGNARPRSEPKPFTGGFPKPTVLRRFPMERRAWHFVVSSDGRAMGWIEYQDFRIVEIDSGQVRSGKSDWPQIRQFVIAGNGQLAFQCYDALGYTWYSARDRELVRKDLWKKDPPGFARLTGVMI